MIDKKKPISIVSWSEKGRDQGIGLNRIIKIGLRLLKK